MTSSANPFVIVTITACTVGAVAIDLFGFPIGPRTDLPIGLSALTFAALLIMAITASFYFTRWQSVAYTALGLTAALAVGPTYLALESIGVTDAIIQRRIIIAAWIWIIALAAMHRKRGENQVAAARTDLKQKVSGLETRLEALTQVAFDGVICIEDGMIREASERCAEGIGYELSEIIGRPVLDFVAASSRARVIESLKKEKLIEPIEIALVRKDGSVMYAECVATNVPTPDGEVRISGLRDIGRRLALEREIVMISERERTRIGYDIHDHIGQVLVSAKWATQMLVRELEKREPDLASDGRQLTELVDQAIAETRRISSRLAPQVPSSLEIYPALRLLSIDVNKHTGLNCTLRCSRQERLDGEETTIHLYRIAEEGVSNALKHSSAENIELNLERQGDTYLFEVLDDGVGIDSSPERVEGLGMRSMKYRARLIRGSVDLARRAGGGTRLACSFPA